MAYYPHLIVFLNTNFTFGDKSNLFHNSGTRTVGKEGRYMVVYTYKKIIKSLSSSTSLHVSKESI